MGFFEGLSSGLSAGTERDLQRSALQDRRRTQAGESALGDLWTNQNAIPGSTPMTGLQGLLQKGASMLGIGGSQQMQGGAPQAAPAPTGGAGPQGGAPQGGGQVPGMGPDGKFDLPTIITKLRERHPDLDGPTMFAAVNAAMPLMNQQSLQQWRQMSAGIREQGIQENIRHHGVTESQGGEKISFGEGMANRKADQTDRKIDQKDQQFQEKEGRLKQQFNTRMQLANDKLANAKTTSEKAQAFREMEATIKDAHAAASQRLSAENSVMATADERKQNIDQANAERDAALQKLDALKLRERQREATGGIVQRPTFQPPAAPPGAGQMASALANSPQAKQMLQQGQVAGNAAGPAMQGATFNQPGQAGPRQMTVQGPGNGGAPQAQNGRPTNFSPEQIMASAKQAIANKPAAREAIIARLRQWGVDTTGL